MGWYGHQSVARLHLPSTVEPVVHAAQSFLLTLVECLLADPAGIFGGALGLHDERLLGFLLAPECLHLVDPAKMKGHRHKLGAD